MAVQAVVMAEAPQRKPAARPKVVVEESRTIRMDFPEEMALADLRDRTNTLKAYPAHARVRVASGTLTVSF